MAEKSLSARCDEVLAKARAIVAAAPKGMTPDQLDTVEGLMAQFDELRAQRDADKKSADLLARVNAAATPAASAPMAGSIGEHFVKAAAEGLHRQATGSHVDVTTPEYVPAKAASAPLVTTIDDNQLKPWTTDFRRDFVNAYRERLVVADLCGAAETTLSTISYLVEKPHPITEGGFTTVAEAGAKPYVRYDAFEMVTEGVSKVAGLTKISEEMLADLPFVADWVNNRLIYDLSVTEEQQLLTGDGKGTNLKGLLHREGVQEVNIEAGADADGIFKASQLVPRATGLTADALIVNPVDYVRIRLLKDKNGQYLAGGPFQGQYGQGGVLLNPPMWGLRTVDTPAIPEGTYLTGAFRQGATIVRKGGVRVDSSNSNVDDFEHDLVTLRAEERLGLMVPRPAAFVTGKFTAAAA